MKKEIFRKQFLELLVALLENGFSLQESLSVMERSGQFPKVALHQFMTGLIQGNSFAQCFLQVGFSKQQALQIQLAETHGDLNHTLRLMLQHIQLFEKQQKELRKVATYPILLLTFVVSLLIGMRLFLLPPLLESGMIDPQHLGMLFLKYSPFILMGIVLIGCLVSFVITWHFKQRSILEKARFLAKIPFFGTLYQLYQTSYFALEWGRLFRQGMEAHQILAYMMAIEQETLLTAVAKEVHEGLALGQSLATQLERYPFLTKEFPLIIYQGEVKGKLGEELFIYSQLLLNKFIVQIEKYMQWIQPLVFLFVAMLILAIYMAMFLPIYGNIGGMME
ncbi:competence type IV pilus assembly protein ComGB [Enterococcus saccharolyticus]|uniref:competence type IV pilus assembly protein ComGB n=1 Tax=Enterococcus saccharolyticus TaxID=41997 RepID=UPI0039E0A688